MLTTHSTRIFEYKLAGVASTSYRFKGIEIEQLKQTIQQRIALATGQPAETIELDEKSLQAVVAQFKDDFRGILHYLYDQFNAQHHGKSATV